MKFRPLYQKVLCTQIWLPKHILNFGKTIHDSGFGEIIYILKEEQMISTLDSQFLIDWEVESPMPEL